jgi:peptidoglycan/xylan/chitin deacetylase (PgdA/CDA1 family)
VILLYHRVASPALDPQLLCVSPERFEAHLDVLRGYRPTPLGEMARRAADGEDLRRRVSVTFDDGYVDNGTTARPMLEARYIPATVFVATGYADSGREFWWDELERLLLLPGHLPPELTLDFGDERRSWILGSSGAPEDGGRDWNVASPETPSPRHAVYRDLHRLLKPMDEGRRRSVLEQVAEAVGDPGEPRPTHRPMTPAELAELARSEWVALGAHTVTHPQLSALGAAEQTREIETSRSRLQAVSGKTVETFSYPYGARSDFDETSVDVVRRAGFGCACANSPGGIEDGTDPFRLPRFLVRDWDREEFAGRLASMFRG